MKILSVVTGILCGFVCGCVLLAPVISFWAGFMWIFVWGDTGSKSALVNTLSGASFYVLGAVVLLVPAIIGGRLGYQNTKTIRRFLWPLLIGSILVLGVITTWVIQHL